MGEVCPRSMNHRPDDFPAADCMAAGECGCKTPHQHYIAGLKEADVAWRAGVQHAINVIVLIGPPGHEDFRDAVIERLAQHRDKRQPDIAARISELEKGE